LKVRAKGYKILYTPYALAYHYENASRKDNEALLYHPEDRKVFIEKWGELIAKGDPCYNPNLSLDSYIPVPKG
jgi:GT2 family glycosyltransferase